MGATWELRVIVCFFSVHSDNINFVCVLSIHAMLFYLDMLHTPSASKPTAGIHVVPPHHLGRCLELLHITS